MNYNRPHSYLSGQILCNSENKSFIPLKFPSIAQYLLTKFVNRIIASDKQHTAGANIDFQILYGYNISIRYYWNPDTIFPL